jgi:RNA polymerase sigma-70 factor (ECF subfamily)
MTAPDAELVARVLEGEVEAFGALVERHLPRCERFALHMLGDPADAEDAVQEAFVRAYRGLAGCRNPERFGAWLMRILANRCRTARLRRWRREQVVVADHGALGVAAVRPRAERYAWREEIAAALARLPDEQREAFLLKHVEELEYEEMAEVTGAGVSALKMRVKRACDRLRQLLMESDVRGS